MKDYRLISRGAVILAPLVLSLGACGEDDPRPGLGTTGFPGTTTGSDPMTDEGPDDGDDDDEPACVPGSQNDCNCTDGGEGFQVCNDAGSGFGDCMCASEDDTTDDGGSDESSTGAADPCGNGMCEEDLDEDCASCEADCGVCAPCPSAPSCDGAEIPPANPMEATNLNDPMAYIPPPQILDELQQAVQGDDIGARIIAAALSDPDVDESPLVTSFRTVFDQHPEATDAVRRQLAAAGMPDPQQYSVERTAPSTDELVAFAASHQQLAVQSGVFSTSQPDVGLSPAPDHAAGGTGDPCEDPRVRIRVARLDVHEEDDDFLNDEIYCAITTEAAEHAEIKVTPITSALDEGDSVDYSLDGGLIWGQGGLQAPMGNILITYNCIESDTANGYPDLLSALGDAAGDVDGEAIGVDGWVFPAVGVVTNLLAGALTLDGDDLLFNASQIIPSDQLLPLIYGAFWSVRRDGTNLNSDWDWELRMEMWGCHDYGTGVAPAG
ncbi:MAG: hypothetical protein AAF721_17000 [Myxococcota bacterium]